MSQVRHVNLWLDAVLPLICRICNLQYTAGHTSWWTSARVCTRQRRHIAHLIYCIGLRHECLYQPHALVLLHPQLRHLHGQPRMLYVSKFILKFKSV
jgi:hypothetical protein